MKAFNRSNLKKVKEVFVFSGLGVDKRVFDNINFENIKPIFIDWLPPLKDETLKDYSKRISQKVTGEKPILIGLSFGGIVAIEISKLIKTENVILIASAKTKFELPLIYKIAGKLKVIKFIPSSLLKSSNLITNWFFGVQEHKHKLMLKQILKETDLSFLKWAINEISIWENIEKPKKYIHIHGNKDRIIPINNVEANYVIKNGGHFMTVNKSIEIQKIINNAIT